MIKKPILEFLKVFIVLVIISELTILLFYHSKIKANNNIFFNHEKYVVNMQNQAINKELKVIIDDVILLAEHTQILEIWEADKSRKEKLINQLRREYQVFSKGRGQLYDQLRYIDVNGDERVRINMVNGKPQIVQKDNLQNKKMRYYFRDIMKLNENQIYISPLDLNIEYGEIELPLKPMIRVGKAVYDSDKQIQGVVVINFLAQSIIDVFETNTFQSLGHNYFLNSDGYYLKSDTKEEEWGFMFEAKENISFANLFPKEWKKINGSVSGQFSNNRGVITFTTVFPLTSETISSSGSNKAFEPSKELIEPDKYYWKVVSYITKSEMQALNWPIWKEFLIFSVFLCLAISILSLIITDLRRKQKNAEFALRQTNQNLEELVEERTKELVYAKVKAEESDRLKTAFLANMSHEIRTPMNGILGFLNLLNRPNLTGKQQKEYIHIIEKSGNRMLETINNIINISKIEAGYESIGINEVNVQELIENLFSFFIPEAEQKGLLLNFINNLTDDENLIQTDNEKLYSILTNLLKNAIKFTQNGFVEFGCNKKTIHSEIFLEFFISDSGIGIPENRKQAVFERFVQADIDDINVYEGSGLGLSISRAYIELLGGEIWFDSTEGSGTKFFFTIPYIPVNTNHKPTTEKTKELDIVHLKHLKVLITEDDKTSELLLVHFLKPICKKLHIARNGLEAIEICQKNSDIDLVLMDIKMQGMNGFEAVRKIRSFNKETIIIAQTALTVNQIKSEYIQAGCDDFVTKPIKEKELFQKINQYFTLSE